MKFKELNNYIGNGNQWHIYREGFQQEDGSSTYEITFEAANSRFFCYIHDAGSLPEALGVFMRAHPHVTYSMVTNHRKM